MTTRGLHFILTIAGATAPFLTPSAHAAYVSVWQAGVDNNSNSDFGQEDSLINSAPGSATAKDDDYYFAGTYPAPINIVATNEPNLDFERALTISDPINRIHFNLTPAQIDPNFEYRFIIDTVSNASGIGTNPIPFTATINGTEIFSGSVAAAAQTFTTPAFFNSTANFTTGDNVLEITRSTTTGVGWMQFDFVRMEVQVPEPATAGLLALAATGLLVRRRRARAFV